MFKNIMTQRRIFEVIKETYDIPNELRTTEQCELARKGICYSITYLAVKSHIDILMKDFAHDKIRDYCDDNLWRRHKMKKYSSYLWPTRTGADNFDVARKL